MGLLFYSFAFFGLVSSFAVVSVNNPIYSVFFLIVVFCLSSCVLLVLTVDFLSIIFIVVYVGAIAVLFLFVVMMLNIRLSQVMESVVRFLPLVIILGFLFLMVLYYFIFGNLSIVFGDSSIDWVSLLNVSTEIILIAGVIYTHYVYAFIIAGLILLLSMIGTISLTLLHSLDVKRQNVYEQTGRSIMDSIVCYIK